jgi:hypothetical protein
MMSVDDATTDAGTQGAGTARRQFVYTRAPLAVAPPAPHRACVGVRLASRAHRRVVRRAEAAAGCWAGRRLERRCGRRLGGRHAEARLARAGRRARQAVHGGARADAAARDASCKRRLIGSRRRALQRSPTARRLRAGAGAEALLVALAPAAVAGAAGGEVHRGGGARQQRRGDSGNESNKVESGQRAACARGEATAYACHGAGGRAGGGVDVRSRGGASRCVRVVSSIDASNLGLARALRPNERAPR